MKNLKVNKKLWVGFGAILMIMAVIIGMAMVGMEIIHRNTMLYVEETLPNVNGVWSMRRNMVSIQRYFLLALQSADAYKTLNYLKTIDREAAEVQATYEAYCKTTRASQADLDRVTKYLTEIEKMRQGLKEQMLQNDKQANARAVQLFNNQYKPAIDDLGEALLVISDEQAVQSAAQAKKAETTYHITLIALFCTLGAAFAISFFLIVRITRYIMKPLREVEVAVSELSGGNLEATVTYESKDEFGATCDSMRTTLSELKRVIGEIAGNMTCLENGDFTVTPSMTFPGDFAQIETSLSNFITRMNELLHHIVSSAEQVNSGAEQVSGSAQSLAQGATEQASSVQELAATVNEISVQTAENAGNAQRTRETVMTVGNQMEESNRKMADMIAAMSDITRSSREIAKIIKTIEDIAFQTNILALNAAVEAARAGAAGKGFAVVADEVRNLANKCSEASKSTSALIDSSLKAVQNGTKIADETAGALSSAVEGVNSVVSVIDEISKASTRQTESVVYVKAGIEQISTVVQNNSATSEESAAASEELSAQAQTLKKLAGEFTLHSETHAPLCELEPQEEQEPVAVCAGMADVSKY